MAERERLTVGLDQTSLQRGIERVLRQLQHGRRAEDHRGARPCPRRPRPATPPGSDSPSRPIRWVNTARKDGSAAMPRAPAADRRAAHPRGRQAAPAARDGLPAASAATARAPTAAARVAPPESSRHHGRLRSSPPTIELLEPAPSNRRCSPSRAPNSITTPSATSRRAVNTSAFHGRHVQPLCVVDQTQHRPWLRGGRQQRQRPGRHQEAIAPLAGSQAKGRRKRLALRARQLSRLSTIGHTNPCSPANARSDSPSTPVTRSTLIAPARSAAYANRAVLPIPASPRTTSEPLSRRHAASSMRSMAARSRARSTSPECDSHRHLECAIPPSQQDGYFDGWVARHFQQPVPRRRLSVDRWSRRTASPAHALDHRRRLRAPPGRPQHRARRPRVRCRSSGTPAIRRDVLVDAEEIRRVIASFDRCEPSVGRLRDMPHGREWSLHLRGS